MYFYIWLENLYIRKKSAFILCYFLFNFIIWEIYPLYEKYSSTVFSIIGVTYSLPFRVICLARISSPSELESMLLELAHRAITEDEADVIITAGAPLAGLAHRVRDRIPVPMVEGVCASVKMPRRYVPSILSYPRPDRSDALPESPQAAYPAHYPN